MSFKGYNIKIVSYMLFIILIFYSNLSFASSQRPLITEDASLIPAGSYSIEIGFEHFKDYPILFKGKEFKKDRDLTKLPAIGVNIGVSDNVEIKLQYEALYVDDKKGTEYDTGDLRIWTKIKVLEESGMLPNTSIRFGVKLPNARYEERGFGTNETDFFAQALFSKKFYGIYPMLNLGLGILGNPNENQNQDDVFMYGFGIIIPINRYFNIASEINGFEGSKEHDKPSSFRSGIQINLFGIRWDIAGSYGLSNDSEDWGIIFGATLESSL
jgi:hypothetical protein